MRKPLVTTGRHAHEGGDDAFPLYWLCVYLKFSLPYIFLQERDRVEESTRVV